jgi:hypothetical protein
MAVAMAECNHIYFPDHMRGDLEYLQQFACVGVLVNAVYLADLIDNFAAVLETDPRTAAVARGCRDDLDTLLILADLCEDVGRPLAAAEARYLHRLAAAEMEEGGTCADDGWFVNPEDVEEPEDTDDPDWE